MEPIAKSENLHFKYQEAPLEPVPQCWFFL